jgi:dihydrofolate reductase
MISLIFAHYRGIIGFENALPWKNMSKDMAWFKAITLGNTVIMGRKTYESIGNPLEGRQNIVLSTDEAFLKKIRGFDNVQCASSIEEVQQIVGRSNSEAIVIGGAMVYNAFLPYATKVYETEIVECSLKNGIDITGPIDHLTTLPLSISYELHTGMRAGNWSKTIVHSNKLARFIIHEKRG